MPLLKKALDRRFRVFDVWDTGCAPVSPPGVRARARDDEALRGGMAPRPRPSPPSDEPRAQCRIGGGPAALRTRSRISSIPTDFGM